jgi:hypothetical protein
MLFRTELPMGPFPVKISHNQPVMLVGSCFAENIGHKLAQYKFQIERNPFGILFNPASVAQSLIFITSHRQFSESDLFHHQGLYHSFYHHGRFSGSHRNSVLKHINQRITNASSKLLTSNVLFITLGTSWVYEHKQTGIVVSNCHKVNANEFKKYMLTLNQVVEMLTGAICQVRLLNPNLAIVLTVSPVRHLADGFTQNQLSKAVLLLACGQLAEKMPGVHYFPAYELMVDDLRDYRFYADDMVHPNHLAVNYIWEKFGQAFFLSDTVTLNQQIEKVVAAANHRPFNTKSEAHAGFVNSTLEKINHLAQQFPHLDFSPELALLCGS